MTDIRVEHSHQGYRAIAETDAGTFVTAWHATEEAARRVAQRWVEAREERVCNDKRE